MDSSRPGRPYILFVIGTSLLSSLLTIVRINVIDGPDRLATQAVRFLLTAGLCVLLYRGVNWARLLMAVLAGLAAIGGAFGGLALFAATRHPGAFLVLIQAALYLGCSIILFSRPARAYVGR